MKHFHAGWDYFSPMSNDKTERMSCRCCGAEMEVQRNVKRTRSRFGHSIPENDQYDVDEFTCSNSNQDWHHQAIAILKLVERTPSNKLAQLYKEEVAELIMTKKATKSDDSWVF